VNYAKPTLWQEQAQVLWIRYIGKKLKGFKTINEESSII